MYFLRNFWCLRQCLWMQMNRVRCFLSGGFTVATVDVVAGPMGCSMIA